LGMGPHPRPLSLEERGAVDEIVGRVGIVSG